MDGVLADFAKAAKHLQETRIPDKLKGESFLNRPDLHLDFSTFDPMPGAKDAVAKIIAMGHDVYIASTPPWDNPDAWGQKRNWIQEHFPALKRKVFLTHNKNLLMGDILIDDTTYRGQKDFNGTFMHFGKQYDWNLVVSSIETMTNLTTN